MRKKEKGELLTHGKFFCHPISTHNSHFKSGDFQQKIPYCLEHVLEGWSIPVVFTSILDITSRFLTICWSLGLLSNVIFHNVLYCREVHLIGRELCNGRSTWCFHCTNFFSTTAIWVPFKTVADIWTNGQLWTKAPSSTRKFWSGETP